MPIQISGSTEIPRQIVSTDAYLNDAIEFILDPRFAAVSVLADVSGANYYTRGIDNFIQVDLNSTTQSFYPINLYSPTYTSASISQFINNAFTELGQ